MEEIFVICSDGTGQRGGLTSTSVAAISTSFTELHVAAPTLPSTLLSNWRITIQALGRSLRPRIFWCDGTEDLQSSESSDGPCLTGILLIATQLSSGCGNRATAYFCSASVEEHIQFGASPRPRVVRCSNAHEKWYPLRRRRPHFKEDRRGGGQKNLSARQFARTTKKCPQLLHSPNDFDHSRVGKRREVKHLPTSLVSLIPWRLCKDCSLLIVALLGLIAIAVMSGVLCSPRLGSFIHLVVFVLAHARCLRLSILAMIAYVATHIKVAFGLDEYKWWQHFILPMRG